MDTGLNERGIRPELANNIVNPFGVNKIFHPIPGDFTREIRC